MSMPEISFEFAKWHMTGEPPPVDKVEQLAKWFVDSIWTARKSAEGDAPANRRKRLAAGLRAVSDLVGLFDGEMAQDFAALSSALADLDLGAEHPMLERGETDTRHPYDSEKWRAYACLALAMHAWMRSGMSVTEASKRVGELAGIEHKTIIQWRKDFMAGRCKNKEASDFFSHDSRIIDGSSNGDWLDWIAHLMTGRARLILMHRP